MPLKITLEDQFLEDLAKLADYIAAAADIDTADRFSDRLLPRCEALLLAPRHGCALWPEAWYP